MSQALLHDPDVLILDEPTAGLDPNQIRGVRATMRRLSEANKTILLSTHILQEVEAMASRVVMINEGRMDYDGNVDELRQRGEYDLDEAFYVLPHPDDEDEDEDESEGDDGSQETPADQSVPAE